MSKQKFTEAEWNQLRHSVAVLGIAMMHVGPNSVIGVAQEGMAASRALKDARRGRHGSPLLKALADDINSPPGRKATKKYILYNFNYLDRQEVVAEALRVLTTNAALIEEKSPADAPQYRRWIVDLAQDIAKAAREGDLLNFGGRRISADEQVFLVKLRHTLNMGPPESEQDQ